jgi:hypothetical protein
MAKLGLLERAAVSSWQVEKEVAVGDIAGVAKGESAGVVKTVEVETGEDEGWAGSGM